MVSSLGSLTDDQVKCRGEEWKEGERRGGDKTEMERKTDEEPLSNGLYMSVTRQEVPLRYAGPSASLCMERRSMVQLLVSTGLGTGCLSTDRRPCD